MSVALVQHSKHPSVEAPSEPAHNQRCKKQCIFDFQLAYRSRVAHFLKSPCGFFGLSRASQPRTRDCRKIQSFKNIAVSFESGALSKDSLRFCGPENLRIWPSDSRLCSAEIIRNLQKVRHSRTISFFFRKIEFFCGGRSGADQFFSC